MSAWGYHPDFVARALPVLEANAGEWRVKELARALADYLAASPDCNAAVMLADTLAFLREIAAADGVNDEREELAIDAIDAVFKAHGAWSLDAVRRGLDSAAATAGEVAARAQALGGKLLGRR